jgi:hypothetical protein
MKRLHNGESGAEEVGAAECRGKVGGVHNSNGLRANMKEHSIY